jgi:uncharacterized glyoxalase superfamily protein PhnB
MAGRVSQRAEAAGRGPRVSRVIVSAVKNRSAPGATVVPVLVYEDVDRAIEWLCATFGFKERLRAGPPGGGVVFHAQLSVGDEAVMLGRQGAEFRAPRPGEVSQFVVVHVDDVDAHFERSRRLGAQILKPPVDMPFGERQYTVEDPWGHRWTFSQPVADVALETWGAREPPTSH